MPSELKATEPKSAKLSYPQPSMRKTNAPKPGRHTQSCLVGMACQGYLPESAANLLSRGVLMAIESVDFRDLVELGLEFGHLGRWLVAQAPPSQNPTRSSDWCSRLVRTVSHIGEFLAAPEAHVEGFTT